MESFLIFAGLIDSLAWLLNPHNWWTILQVALGLGFVIFVHELGHFLVAKACGVKCEKFYLGFDIYGLKLFSFQKGETEYGIGILPLGGYVKMLGQDDNPYKAAAEMERARTESTASPPHIPSGDLPPEPMSPHPQYDPRSYMAQSVPERMAIISAGVIMNVVFAVIMASVAYGMGIKVLPCRISQVFAGGPAWEAGLRPDDTIVRIGELENPLYEDLRTRIPVSNVKEGIEFVVQRPGESKPLTFRLHPHNDIGLPLIGVDGPRKLELNASYPVEKFSAANRVSSDLLPGDEILKVDGVEIHNLIDWQRELFRRQNAPLELTLRGADAALSDEQSSESTAGNTELNFVPELKTVIVPASRRKTVGFVMEMSPIKAVQDGSPAAAAGLKAGDRILQIDGEAVGDPLTLGDRLARRASDRPEVALLVQRDGKKIEIRARLRPVTWLEEPSHVNARVSAAALGIAYNVSPTVQSVDPGSPAAEAGIKPGDVVSSIQLVVPPVLLASDKDLRQPEPFKLEGDRINDWPLAMEVMQNLHPRGWVRLSIQSGPKNWSVELPPAESEQFFNADRGIVLSLDQAEKKADGPAQALGWGLEKTGESLTMVYRFLQKLGHQISPKMLGGPVTIAQVAGQSTKDGFPALLMFLTMLSANLAVVNFLPIPVLDGGHMVFLMWEGITGKPPSERVFVILTYLGFAFILTLMLFVLGLDFGLISRR